jgi:hypothetical protein
MAEVSAKYVIVEAPFRDALEEAVTRLIRENWMPQGGVMIVHYGEGDFLYAQAMTFNVL